MTRLFEQACVAAACLGMVGQASAEVQRWDIEITGLRGVYVNHPDNFLDEQTVGATGYFLGEDGNGDQIIDLAELLHFELYATTAPTNGMSTYINRYDKRDSLTSPFDFRFDVASNTVLTYWGGDYWEGIDFGAVASVMIPDIQGVQYFWVRGNSGTPSATVTKITLVPEPGALGMAVSGLAILIGALVSRRRRRRH